MSGYDELIAEAEGWDVDLVSRHATSALDTIKRLAAALEVSAKELTKSDKAFSNLKQQHAAADVELVNLKARLTGLSAETRQGSPQSTLSSV